MSGYNSGTKCNETTIVPIIKRHGALRSAVVWAAVILVPVALGCAGWSMRHYVAEEYYVYRVKSCGDGRAVEKIFASNKTENVCRIIPYLRRSGYFNNKNHKMELRHIAMLAKVGRAALPLMLESLEGCDFFSFLMVEIDRLDPEGEALFAYVERLEPEFLTRIDHQLTYLLLANNPQRASGCIKRAVEGAVNSVYSTAELSKMVSRECYMKAALVDNYLSEMVFFINCCYEAVNNGEFKQFGVGINSIVEFNLVSAVCSNKGNMSRKDYSDYIQRFHKIVGYLCQDDGFFDKKKWYIVKLFDSKAVIGQDCFLKEISIDLSKSERGLNTDDIPVQGGDISTITTYGDQILENGRYPFLIVSHIEIGDERSLVTGKFQFMYRYKNGGKRFYAVRQSVPVSKTSRKTYVDLYPVK